MAGHPWELSSLYDFQFFCCPECDYKVQERQYFVNHAYWTHPDSVKFLSVIEDGSLYELSLPWIKTIELDEQLLVDVKDEIILKKDIAAVKPAKKRKVKIKEESDDDYFDDEDEDYTPVKRPYRKRSSLIECDQCGEDFENVADLSQHVAEHHADMSSQIKCEDCDIVCSSGSVLNTHYKVDHGKTICDICSKICESKNDLKDHMGEKHANNKKTWQLKRVNCGSPDCAWNGGKGQIKEHWRRKHSGEEFPFLCSQCPHRTLTNTALNAHVKYHHVKCEEIYSCQKCSYTTRLRDHLTRHDKVVHLRVKEFHCEHCISSFGTKRDLLKHLVAIHKVVLPDEKKMKKISESILKRKLVKCGKCDCEWKGTKGQIKDHWEETHQDDPYPYICDKCAHRTLTATALAAHVRNQHVEMTETWQCDKCSFSTRTKERLKRHEKNVHIRVRDFQCEFCPSAFQIKQDLQKHLVGVHKVVLPDEKKMKAISNALGEILSKP